MVSITQIAANIANSAKSTGPKTEPGKQRVRLNAFRHGLTGQTMILSPEDRAAFDAHCDGIREHFNPEGAYELDLAQSIAEDRWRLRRARALENGIYALGQDGEPGEMDAAGQVRTWLAEGKNIQLLALYEQRIHRSIEKSLVQLRAAQAECHTAHEKALEETHLLARLAYMRNQPYDPAADGPPAIKHKNGFDFSPEGIHSRIDRNLRLDEARFFARLGWDRKAHYQRPGFRLPEAA